MKFIWYKPAVIPTSFVSEQPIQTHHNPLSLQKMKLTPKRGSQNTPMPARFSRRSKAQHGVTTHVWNVDDDIWMQIKFLVCRTTSLSKSILDNIWHLHVFWEIYNVYFGKRDNLVVFL